MRWFNPFLIASTLSAILASALDNYTVPPGSPGYQFGNSSQIIQFDEHSLFINGSRTFIFSGEFHPWRIPVPELWSDILQKMKAGGFNAVSIYVHWGLVEGKQGDFNFDYYRSLELFYEIAMREGILVLARPGPYINAETTGGGFPGWLTNVNATARTNQTGFVEAWTPYVQQVASITSKFQYPNGPVIAVQSENEFAKSSSSDPTASEAMALLNAAYRDGGIDQVPITFNDAAQNGNFASGLGEVDIYTFDSYPAGFDCSHPDTLPELPTNFISNHGKFAPWAPIYIAEFQGGSFDPWGGPGYNNCATLLGGDFANVFYKANVGFGATVMSLYMAYGGTNWGNLATPVVYTSYDYAAAIREQRTLAPKFSEIKLQTHFYHASPSLWDSSIIGQGANGTFASNQNVFVTNRRANGTNATNFYFLRQLSNSILTDSSTSLKVNTSAGALTIPQFGGQITLQGRESKILVTDYSFGTNTLLYSTGEIFTQTSLSGIVYLVLYGSEGQPLEAVISAPTGETGTPAISGSSSISVNTTNDGSLLITGTPSGISVVDSGSDTVIIIADKTTALTFWQTFLQSQNDSPYDVSYNASSVLLAGPYLIRNATIYSSTLELFGDTNETTTLTLLAGPSNIDSIAWNGQPVDVTQSDIGLQATLVGPSNSSTFETPDLSTAMWRTMNSLPEADPDFDDSDFVVANKTSTSRPQQPFAGDVILYADEYGFHSGNFIFRGYFNGSATGVTLSVQGGDGFGFSAFLNGQFLGSGQGSASADLVNTTFAFDTNVTNSGTNVLTVVMDSTGLDEEGGSVDQFKNPRGIRGYSLSGNTFDTWKLIGNFGGEDYPDKVRGPYNEGGLWAERVGAILPGFDDFTWNTSSPLTGISSAGVQVYRTNFSLDIPDGLDVPFGFQFTLTNSSNYRSVLYVNGWQFGRFTSNLGPQSIYPVPEGILNHHGDNTIAVTLWSLDEQGAAMEDFQLVPLAVFVSGKEVVSTDVVTSPGFSELRGSS